MKIKLKDKGINIPNCWKSCGASQEDWEDLKSGKEIEVKRVSDGIKNLVVEKAAKSKPSPKKQKESK